MAEFDNMYDHRVISFCCTDFFIDFKLNKKDEYLHGKLMMLVIQGQQGFLYK